MEKTKLDRYERAYRYVRDIAQQHCESYTQFCLRTDVIVEAIRKAQKYDKLEKENIEYESLKETVDEANEIISELNEENKKLKETLRSINEYLVNNDIQIDYGKLLFSYLTPEEYELIKEVLKDE